jgi:hypothetical protein
VPNAKTIPRTNPQCSTLCPGYRYPCRTGERIKGSSCSAINNAAVAMISPLLAIAKAKRGSTGESAGRRAPSLLLGRYQKYMAVPADAMYMHNATGAAAVARSAEEVAAHTAIRITSALGLDPAAA